MKAGTLSVSKTFLKCSDKFEGLEIKILLWKISLSSNNETVILRFRNKFLLIFTILVYICKKKSSNNLQDGK